MKPRSVSCWACKGKDRTEKRKLLSLILALAMCLTFTACGDEDTVVEIEAPVEEEAAPVEAEVSSDGSWAV